MAAKRILIIEDEEDLLDDLITIVEKDGHSAVAAKDGSEGIFKFKNQTFDMVITDINMPKTDGLGVIQSIRRAPGLQHLPIIVISANVAEYRSRLMEMKDLYVLEKPFKPQDLRGIIQRVSVKSKEELKLRSELIPNIVKCCKSATSDLLATISKDEIKVSEEQFNHGPGVIEAEFMAVQNIDIEGIQGSFILMFDKPMGLNLMKLFGKPKGDAVTLEPALHGIFLYSRAIGRKMKEVLRSKKVRIKVDTPAISGTFEGKIGTFIEGTHRYREVNFTTGLGNVKLVYLYS